MVIKKLMWWEMTAVAVAVWCVDFTQTAVALNLYDNFTEANPISAWFMSFGLWGWIAGFIFAVFWLSLTMFFVYKLAEWSKREYIKYVAVLLFIVLEIIVIINNFMIMTIN